MTDKANEETTRRGGPKLAHKVHETDIGIVRNILGHDFGLLMEQPSELLDAVRMLVTYLRTLERKTERSDRVEEFRLFVKRYLPYMTSEVQDARMSTTGRRGRLPFRSVKLWESWKACGPRKGWGACFSNSFCRRLRELPPSEAW
ncbi:MAG: hypothetical protein FD153_1954 [Rhodospirillaceae bacterium]|nr:MAG: hypothetical protein FD153_1954 [Rhodospirillaceae bacterium]